MKIFIEKTKENKTLEFSGSAKELLVKLELNPEAVLIARNGALVTLDETLSNTDEIKILSVISGG